MCLRLFAVVSQPHRKNKGLPRWEGGGAEVEVEGRTGDVDGGGGGVGGSESGKKDRDRTTGQL